MQQSLGNMESSNSDGPSSRQLLGQSLLQANETVLEEHLPNDGGEDAVKTSPYPVSVRSVSPRSYDCLAGDREGQATPESGGLDFQDTSREKITSVAAVLQRLAVGNTFHARGEEWKLTRAAVHAQDAWKGCVSPCPGLDHERVRQLFKLRWRYRALDFFLVHMFLVLSLLEVPAWCIRNDKCFWNCYPDFTRNYHMQSWLSLTLEGSMLFVLVGIALLDMVRLALLASESCFREALGVELMHTSLD